MPCALCRSSKSDVRNPAPSVRTTHPHHDETSAIEQPCTPDGELSTLSSAGFPNQPSIIEEKELSPVVYWRFCEPLERRIINRQVELEISYQTRNWALSGLSQFGFVITTCLTAEQALNLDLIGATNSCWSFDHQCPCEIQNEWGECGLKNGSIQCGLYISDANKIFATFVHTWGVIASPERTKLKPWTFETWMKLIPPSDDLFMVYNASTTMTSTGTFQTWDIARFAFTTFGGPSFSILLKARLSSSGEIIFTLGRMPPPTEISTLEFELLKPEMFTNEYFDASWQYPQNSNSSSFSSSSFVNVWIFLSLVVLPNGHPFISLLFQGRWYKLQMIQSKEKTESLFGGDSKATLNKIEIGSKESLQFEVTELRFFACDRDLETIQAESRHILPDAIQSQSNLIRKIQIRPEATTNGGSRSPLQSPDQQVSLPVPVLLPPALSTCQELSTPSHHSRESSSENEQKDQKYSYDVLQKESRKLDYSQVSKIGSKNCTSDPKVDGHMSLVSIPTSRSLDTLDNELTVTEVPVVLRIMELEDVAEQFDEASSSSGKPTMKTVIEMVANDETKTGPQAEETVFDKFSGMLDLSSKRGQSFDKRFKETESSNRSLEEQLEHHRYSIVHATETIIRPVVSTLPLIDYHQQFESLYASRFLHEVGTEFLLPPHQLPSAIPSRDVDWNDPFAVLLTLNHYLQNMHQAIVGCRFLHAIQLNRLCLRICTPILLNQSYLDLLNLSSNDGIDNNFPKKYSGRTQSTSLSSSSSSSSSWLPSSQWSGKEEYILPNSNHNSYLLGLGIALHPFDEQYVFRLKRSKARLICSSSKWQRHQYRFPDLLQAHLAALSRSVLIIRLCLAALWVLYDISILLNDGERRVEPTSSGESLNGSENLGQRWRSESRKLVQKMTDIPQRHSSATEGTIPDVHSIENNSGVLNNSSILDGDFIWKAEGWKSLSALMELGRTKKYLDTGQQIGLQYLWGDFIAILTLIHTIGLPYGLPSQFEFSLLEVLDSLELTNKLFHSVQIDDDQKKLHELVNPVNDTKRRISPLNICFLCGSRLNQNDYIECPICCARFCTAELQTNGISHKLNERRCPYCVIGVIGKTKRQPRNATTRIATYSPCMTVDVAK